MVQPRQAERAPLDGARALLLDALGTLVQLEPPAPRLKAELAKRFDVEVTEAQAKQAITAEIAYYRTHLNEGRDRTSLRTLRCRCAEVLRGALPPSKRSAAIELEPLAEALLAALRFTAFADASPVLRRARARGLRLVVVSNWDVSLHGVLERLELAPLVDGILTSAEAGARKPAAAIFEQALRLAGAQPDESRHVGDSLDEDVAGARRAGITPILLRRHGGSGPPDVLTITSLAELTPS